MKNKTLTLVTMALLGFTLLSCETEEPQIIAPGNEIELIEGVELDYENAFFDDFSNGIISDNWYIADQAWGGGNGGVIPENVSYTDDGILMLRGNGGYYQEGEVVGVGDVKDGRYTGAALISNFLVRPGHYEVKMKVLPRLGACTAFWTFAYEFDEQLNHEIDIELPGGNQSGVPTFANILNTNYIMESRSISQDTKVSEISKEDIYLNDGQWHTFGFDWYTNPERIVYYLDGKVCATTDLFVPSLESRLWLGVWFPVSSAFVGSAEFETDYMYVDYVSYIPFKNQPYTEYSPSPNGYANVNEYPTVPTTQKVVNKIANGTFEYVKEGLEKNSGWKLEKYIFEEKEVSEVCYISKEVGNENSKALVIKDNGVASQIIDAVYNKFKFDLSFIYKGKGTLTVNFYSVDTTMPLNSTVVNLENAEFKDCNLSLEAPIGSMVMEIQFDTFEGETIIIDNVSLIKK